MLRQAAAAGERLDLRVELACNGLFGELPRPYASREPVVLDRCQIARFDPRAWRLHHDFDVLRRLEAEHADGLDPTWAGELLYELNRFCNVWVGARPADLGRGRGDPGAPARAPQRHGHARAVGDRPRPPRHRLAVAAGRELPQGGAHLQLAGRLHGPLPGVPVRLLAGPAVRLDPAPQPGAVRAHPRTRGVRPVAAGRRHLGRARLQPAVRRVAGAPVPPRPALLRAGVRPPLSASSGTRTCSATTASCRRSCAAPGSAASSPRSCPGTGSTRPRTTRSPGRASTAREVLAHFPPADTYNATAEVAELRRSVRDYKDHDRSRRSLLVFGHGDGGGGPTPDDAGDAAPRPRPAGPSAHDHHHQR